MDHPLQETLGYKNLIESFKQSLVDKTPMPPMERTTVAMAKNLDRLAELDKTGELNAFFLAFCGRFLAAQYYFEQEHEYEHKTN